jgi:hypothetical protein
VAPREGWFPAAVPWRASFHQRRKQGAGCLGRVRACCPCPGGLQQCAFLQCVLPPRTHPVTHALCELVAFCRNCGARAWSASPSGLCLLPAGGQGGHVSREAVPL